jgi:hypothetical protein
MIGGFSKLIMEVRVQVCTHIDRAAVNNYARGSDGVCPQTREYVIKVYLKVQTTLDLIEYVGPVR